MSEVLNTGIRNARNVNRYIFGRRSLIELADLLESRRKLNSGSVIFLVDKYFQHNVGRLGGLPCEINDQVTYISTNEEPTTQAIDSLFQKLSSNDPDPCAIVGIGGGCTLDSAKALSNLFTNGGRAADYQGWDLVCVPGVFKIGIPTISGTGAEATRTCVMTNSDTGLKLGMNSDFTVFDQLILDPDLTETVPRDQYFYSGMDAWIHCIESLNGSYRNPVGDAFSSQAIQLCREVFLSSDMMSDDNRAKLMVASYLGGCAIGTSYVGVVHPFSAGLSVVLGVHHCVANCITMTVMEPYYPQEYKEFMRFIENCGVSIPSGICAELDREQFEALYQSTIIHDKPLTNALGERFKDILTRSRVKEIFKVM